MQINVAAAAQAVLELEQAPAALAVWKALTGRDGSYAEAIDLARQVAANPGRAALLLTTDPSDADGAVLVTLWREGSAEVAHREAGRWGIPQQLVAAP